MREKKREDFSSLKVYELEQYLQSQGKSVYGGKKIVHVDIKDLTPPPRPALNFFFKVCECRCAGSANRLYSASPRIC